MYPYQRLEEKFKDFTDSKFAVSCNNGTSALHLAILALGISKGDEVIMGDFVMAACGFAVSYTGAKVVTVDCDDTLCIDWRQIESKITKKTKAIMAVHIYGRLCNMPEILRIAKKHKLKVIEDACEVHGAIWKSKADITCYSFYRNKIIHAEEGGICTTDNQKLANRMNYFKNMCFDEGHTYFHNEIGYNYRMADSQALLALESLEKYKENIKRRWEIKDIYDKHFDINIRLDTVWVYPLMVGNVDKILKILPEARRFFRPLSTMPMWKQKVGKNALEASEKGCYLPVSEDLSNQKIQSILKRLDSVL